MYSSNTFNMTGGSIKGNNATLTSTGNGGGVFQNGGTFSMSNGSITFNTAKGNGGGVYIGNSSNRLTFTLSGGSVTSNTSTGYGGGVYVGDNSTFNLSGAPTMTDLLLSNADLSDTGNITVYENCTTSLIRIAAA